MIRPICGNKYRALNVQSLAKIHRIFFPGLADFLLRGFELIERRERSFVGEVILVRIDRVGTEGAGTNSVPQVTSQPLIVLVDPTTAVEVDLLCAAGDPKATVIDEAPRTKVFGATAPVQGKDAPGGRALRAWVKPRPPGGMAAPLRTYSAAAERSRSQETDGWPRGRRQRPIRT